MLLRSESGEAFSGLAFGATPQTHLRRRDRPLSLSATKPPAHLYRQPRRRQDLGGPGPLGPQDGPRYRCLTWSADKLYACAAGEPGGDPFLVGASSDEGKTWAPAVRLGDLSGAKSCVQAQCLQTEEWLCENYCYCAPGLAAQHRAAASTRATAARPPTPRTRDAAAATPGRGRRLPGDRLPRAAGLLLQPGRPRARAAAAAVLAPAPLGLLL